MQMPYKSKIPLCQRNRLIMTQFLVCMLLQQCEKIFPPHDTASNFLFHSRNLHFVVDILAELFQHELTLLCICRSKKNIAVKDKIGHKMQGRQLSLSFSVFLVFSFCVSSFLLPLQKYFLSALGYVERVTLYLSIYV